MALDCDLVAMLICPASSDGEINVPLLDDIAHLEQTDALVQPAW